MRKLFFFLFSISFFFSQNLKSQETFGNAGVELGVPVGDWAEDVYVLTVGGSGGIEFGLSEKFGLKVNAGLTFLAVDEAAQDIIATTWLIPLELGGRYYFTQQREGLYVEANVGFLLFGSTTEDQDLGMFGEIEGESNTDGYGTFSPGLGYFLNENFSIGLRYRMFFITEDEERQVESETGSYVALRAAYNF